MTWPGIEPLPTYLLYTVGYFIFQLIHSTTRKSWQRPFFFSNQHFSRRLLSNYLAINGQAIWTEGSTLREACFNASRAKWMPTFVQSLFVSNITEANGAVIGWICCTRGHCITWRLFYSPRVSCCFWLKGPV